MGLFPFCSSKDVNKKREQYLEWADYFMATAFLAAKRSKDPCSQVGACIVSPDNKIVGVGYNGMPIGCSDDEFPWSKTTINKIDTKYLYVCHAEMNAILNKNSADVKGCTIYVGLFPCNECAKIIIQSGIVEVVYMSDKHSHKVKTQAAKRMFDFVGIKYLQYQPRMRQIVIDFTELDKNNTAPVLQTPGDTTTSGEFSTIRLILREFNTSQLVPEEFTMSQLVPEKFNMSQLVPEEFNMSQLVSEEFDMSQLVPEEFDMSQLVPEEFNTSQLVPKEFNTSQLVPEEFNMSNYAQESSTVQLSFVPWPHEF
uniref:Probable deoxycytidylate deaminase n=1 Tax=Timema bartmani TaxID=61472 RepID=A0A7R9EWV4_9NEOP|nr:unnamed protein product [Timema bartmani]